jgi:hypothetical protein
MRLISGVILLFEGEKTSLFWIGLLILSLASVAIFAVFWSLLSYLYNPYSNCIPYYAISSNVPIMVGAVVFLLVGLYMMKSGIKQAPNPRSQS